MFNDTLDETCKLEKPKTSKRNPTNNPWITDEIIVAVKSKQKYYSKWNKTKTKKSSNGDQILYQY